MGGAGGQRSGNRAEAGADFDYCMVGEIAEGGCNALDGVSIVKEVLAEFGFGGHGLL
jgi:hypothetical protein